MRPIAPTPGRSDPVRLSGAIVDVIKGIAHAQAIAATAAAYGDRGGIRLGGLVRTCPPPTAQPDADGRYTHVTSALAAAAAQDAEKAELQARASGRGGEPLRGRHPSPV